MLSQKDAGGLDGVIAAEPALTAPISSRGLAAEVSRRSPAVSAQGSRHGGYWMVAVARPLLLSRLKMLLNSCLP